MEPKPKQGDAAGDSQGQGDEYEPSLCYRLVMALLCPFISWMVIYYIIAALALIFGACRRINIDQGYPISSSVQLVAIKGLEPALAPGAAPLAMDLLVRVSNGHFHDEYREGGGITVFYAGVPLAHGSTPNFRVGAKATHTFTVKATAKSVGVPEDLFRLMSAERRWGTAQLQVQMQLGWPGWESFAWSLDLDGREPGTASPSLYPRF
ncbi:hypothetical protein BS78_03G253300 [Paspalum vaginatum]|uniref:Late embryogenesis abundant protein LEA-2 subgroup domain-containing protein n=1 Tax=Paspalum vaginatum TaxID=158149 RepID=A0A9W7X7X3_9POAL|nr:hypothetical protein BS78_K302700 [Paspalum vaginatum]KAJ1285074.1 hypothetical protein BS78_03G253300 [Paspalum vaginatum]